MIYVVWAKGTDLVKVGFTTEHKAAKRIRELQVGCPHELEALVIAEGTEADEATFHEMLKSEHVRGEWFKWGPKAKQVVDILKALPATEPTWRRTARNPHRRLGAALSLEYGKSIHEG